VEYGVELFAEGLSLAAAGGHGLATELVARPWVLSHASSHPFAEAAIYRHVTPGSIMLTPELVDQSIRLFDEPELQRWLVDIPDIERVILDYMRAVDSVISPRAEDIDARRSGVIDAAIPSAFTDEVRQAFKRQLEEMALIFWMTDRERSARMAVAVAGRVATAPSRGSRGARGGLIIPGRSATVGSTDVLEGIPFVRGLVESTIMASARAMFSALARDASEPSDE
jgi:hypothetical protein